MSPDPPPTLWTVSLSVVTICCEVWSVEFLRRKQARVNPGRLDLTKQLLHVALQRLHTVYNDLLTKMEHEHEQKTSKT